MTGSREPHLAHEGLDWLATHGDRLFAYALGRVGDRHLAEELVQETFLAAVESHTRFRGDADVTTWLTGIMRHKILDVYRRRGKKRRLDREEQVNLDDFFSHRGHIKNVSAWDRKQLDSVDTEEFYAVLDRCLDKLGAAVGQAFVLRIIDQLKTEEVCQVLNISATNLSVRLHRGRLALRACLEQNWFGGDG